MIPDSRNGRVEQEGNDESVKSQDLAVYVEVKPKKEGGQSGFDATEREVDLRGRQRGEWSRMEKSVLTRK